MRVEIKNHADNWQEIKNTTLTTIGKDAGVYPTSDWKRKILMAEHSPIRKLKISWKWYDLKYWVSVHFTRHKFGIEHFVSTQRTDRTGVNRDVLSQDSFVKHEVEANAQSIINISRKRLCNCASVETRESWKEVLKGIEKVEPELVSCCVPECVYRGFCPEFKSCGYTKSKDFKNKLELYRKGFE